MLFSQYNHLLCGEEIPKFLGLFDFSTAPRLLFYSYIPIALLSLFVGFFIYKKDNKSLKSKLLFAMSGFFFLWVLNILVQWVGSYHTTLMFAWELTALFEVGFFLTSLRFAYVFIYKKDLALWLKTFLAFLWVGVAILLPTPYNILSYDVTNCEGVVGKLWDVIYAFEPIVIGLIAILGMYAYRKEQSPEHKKQIRLFAVGMTVMLTSFFVSNFYGELTRVYEFNLWGPLGVLIFFIVLGYLVVRYHTFNIKLFGTQALVFLIAIFISAKFFYSTTPLDITLNTATLVAFLVSAVFLIRSVRAEIQQKNKLQELADQLEQSNENLEHANEKLQSVDKLKTEFLSLASHQLRTPLTAIKGYSSMLVEGSFGKLDPKVEEPIKRIYTSAQGLVSIVEDLLNVSKIEQGGMKYEIMPTDLVPLVQSLYNEMQIPAQSKNIIFGIDIPKDQKIIANIDPTKLKQVFLNLADNSIKYTQTGGTITVSLKRLDDTIEFAVKDNGIGISPETKAKLFGKFARGEGGKMNTGGSGLGLYLAQQIARAHKGDIVIESDGLGKGSTFKVVLPAM
jgi:signal transduction histidine kinase